MNNGSKGDSERNGEFIQNQFKTFLGRTIGEIFEIVQHSKSAFYIAYSENYAHFTTFCKKAWSENVIDYRLAPSLNTKQFIIAQKIFNAPTIIFSGNMPKNFLSHIDKGSNLIFYTCGKQNDGSAIMKPSSHSYLDINLTINGFWNFSMTHPTIEILFTFQKLKILTLNTIHICREILVTLYVSRFHSLIINNCKIERTHDSQLTIIIIAFYGENGLLIEAIEEIIEYINYTNIKKMNISMKLNNESINLLKNLKKSNTLQKLKIFEIQDRKQYGEGQFFRKIRFS